MQTMTRVDAQFTAEYLSLSVLNDEEEWNGYGLRYNPFISISRDFDHWNLYTYTSPGDRADEVGIENRLYTSAARPDLSLDREGWNTRYADRDYIWDVIPSRLLASETRELPPGRALDLGCGEGRNSVWLASLGWRVTGVDFSGVGLDKARALARHNGAKVRWVQRDLTRYRPRPRHYHLVLMCYLQLPYDELAIVVKRAAEAVEPGGMFLYIAHDRSNLEHGHGGPPDPAVLRTPGEITAMLPGFRIDRAQVVERAVDAEPGHGGMPGATALDAVVRAHRPGQASGAAP